MRLRWKIAQAAELRWWRRYLRGKPKTDYLRWKRNYWLALLDKTELEFSQSDAILDAGCGPAGIFIALDEQFVDAVDPLLDQYEAKLPHFRKSAYPKVNFIAASLENATLNKKYDKVFCMNAINHVADLDLCFEKLAAATKKGGTLVLSVDAHNFRFFRNIFRLIPGDILHPHQHDLLAYEKMITSKALSIKKRLLLKKEFFFNYYMLVAKKI